MKTSSLFNFGSRNKKNSALNETKKHENASQKQEKRSPKPHPLDALQTSNSKAGTKATIKIIAKIDIGFGNHLYLRGDGCGLSWTKGVKMIPTKNDHWQWECHLTSQMPHLEFKVLVNDETWSIGDNYVATGGSIEISPSF